MHSLLEKINFRLIIIHTIATFFILLAAKCFLLLYNSYYINQYFEIDTHGSLVPLNNLNGSLFEKLFYLLYASIFGGFFGFVISFLLSLFICKKEKIHWLNAIIVLFITLVLNRNSSFSVLVLKKIILLAQHFTQQSLVVSYIISGCLFAGMGLYIFLSRWTNRYLLK